MAAKSPPDLSAFTSIRRLSSATPTRCVVMPGKEGITKLTTPQLRSPKVTAGTEK